MIEIESELDTRLRSFYEHIEEQRPSRGFESFEASRRSRSRKTLNLVAGIAGVAVVTAGVTVSATQLASHHNSKPPAPAPARALPTNAQLTLSLPSISHTVINVTRGHGSASLPTFTPQGIIFMLTACVGAGSYSVISVDHQVGISTASCDAGAITGQTVPAHTSLDGKPLTLQISAEPSTDWEIVVADSGPVAPLPLLGAATIPAGAHILAPATSGTGTSGLQTFSIPAGPYFVQYACVGTGTIGFSATYTNRTGPFASASCANGAIGTVQAAKPPVPGIMDLTVDAPPHTYWEVQVYELPAASG